MAKLGKRTIRIPEGVKVYLEGSAVRLEGPEGKLTLAIPPSLSVVLDKERVKVAFSSETLNLNTKIQRKLEALRGLFYSLLNSRIRSVKESFTKGLEIVGVGYQAEVKGKTLVLKVGFSHPVSLSIPEGIKVKTEKNIISVSGCNPEEVGNFAARIRAVRPPEPYGGKGIRYQGEYVRHKVGKAAGAAGARGEAK